MWTPLVLHKDAHAITKQLSGGQGGGGDMDAQRQHGGEHWRTVEKSRGRAERNEPQLVSTQGLVGDRQKWRNVITVLNARGQNRLLRYVRTLISGILTAINWVTINATSLLSDKTFHG